MSPVKLHMLGLRFGYSQQLVQCVAFAVLCVADAAQLSPVQICWVNMWCEVMLSVCQLLLQA